MTSDIRALSHSEHELFEITSPSSGAARKHYRDDNTHSILSSTPPSVTAQASEMVAEFVISNSPAVKQRPFSCVAAALVAARGAHLFDCNRHQEHRRL